MRRRSGDPDPDLDLIERALLEEAEKARERAAARPFTRARTLIGLLGVWALLNTVLVVLLR